MDFKLLCWDGRSGLSRNGQMLNDGVRGQVVAIESLSSLPIEWGETPRFPVNKNFGEGDALHGSEPGK